MWKDSALTNMGKSWRRPGPGKVPQGAGGYMFSRLLFLVEQLRNGKVGWSVERYALKNAFLCVRHGKLV